MLKTITPDEMKRLEENYMNRTGTSALQLMESAARHVADAAAELAGVGLHFARTAVAAATAGTVWRRCVC